MPSLVARGARIIIHHGHDGVCLCRRCTSPAFHSLALDPIYQSIADQKAWDRLVVAYDHNVTAHQWATGYTWDIVLSGSHRTAVVHDDPELARTLAASVQQRLAA
jgi:hypothetical protein